MSRKTTKENNEKGNRSARKSRRNRNEKRKKKIIVSVFVLCWQCAHEFQMFTHLNICSVYKNKFNENVFFFFFALLFAVAVPLSFENRFRETTFSGRSFGVKRVAKYSQSIFSFVFFFFFICIFQSALFSMVSLFTYVSSNWENLTHCE